MLSNIRHKVGLPEPALFAVLFLPPLQTSRGIPWWVYLLIIVVIIIIIAWALASNREKTPVETHREEAHTAAPSMMESPPPPSRVEVFTAAADASMPATSPTPDDLTIIEGIGPKISAILNASGIHTFSQLEQTGATELRRILSANNLEFIDPTSWGDQARLAAAGDQAGLQALQDRLRGGRQV